MENEIKLKKPKAEYVTKADFDEKFGQLLGLVERIATPQTPAQTEKAEEVKAEKKQSEPNNTPIPPEWNEYVDSRLGKQFGRTLSYPRSGPPQLHISVPQEISNASQAHWLYYKCDMRNVVVKQQEGFEGVKKGIDLVAQHLKLDPRTVAENNNKIK